jgi:hypothetical protein
LDWSCGVQIACAGGWIKHGAGLVVRELFEGFFVMLFGEENAGLRVAGKALGDKAFARGERSCADSFSDVTWRGRERFA